MPISFVDEDRSRGLKRGGVLNAVRHELELVCDAAEIPDEIEISLAGLDIGDSLHISAVTLPKGAEIAITDRDFTIATIVAPSGLKMEAEDAAAEAAEPGPAEVPLVGEDEAEGGEGRRGLMLAACAGSAPCFGSAARRGAGPARRTRRGGRLGGVRARADLGRPRQSRRAICDAPAQCRLHGGRRDRRDARLRAAEEELFRLGPAGPDRRRSASCSSSPPPS